MNNMVKSVIVGLITGLIAFMLSSFFLLQRDLTEINNMGSDNYNTALVLFRNGYKEKKLILFCEKNTEDTFEIDSIVFNLYPASSTTDNVIISNFAAHMNDFVVILATKWIKDKNPSGKILFNRLIELIPNFEVSTSETPPIKIKDIKDSNPIIDQLASQWWHVKPRDR